MAKYKVGDLVESYQYTIRGKFTREEELKVIPIDAKDVDVQIIPAIIVAVNSDGTYDIEEEISLGQKSIDKNVQEKYLYPPNSFTKEELLKKVR